MNPTLNWLEKGESLKTLAWPTYSTLNFQSQLSYGDPQEGNLIIQGDNLDVLKALLPHYEEKIKCIFIDPPYNTKRNFPHYSDRLKSSKWLEMMYPRLILFNKLLSKDGSIWVTISDHEGHYLKVMMDEIFGKKHFVGTIVWQRKYAPVNSCKSISCAHDHILVYRKSSLFKMNLLPRTDKQDSRYKYDDQDGRGLYGIESIVSTKPSKRDSFPIKNPHTEEEYFPPYGRTWKIGQEKARQLLENNGFYFGKDGKGTPKIKSYLREIKPGVVTNSWWPAAEAGDNTRAKRELKALFTHSTFDTSKPEKLISRILHLATHKNDLVLDAFLGSGTSAAVAHKMGRRYIGIEMGDHIKNYCIDRLKKVIDGEQGGISKAFHWQGGGGFRFYQLHPQISVEKIRDIVSSFLLNLDKPSVSKPSVPDPALSLG